MKADSSDPTEKLVEEVSQILRVGAKPRLIAGLQMPNLLSLPCVTEAASSDQPYDLAVALVDQLGTAIDGIGVGSPMGAAAQALFGLDFDTKDLTLQDRRDRAAEFLGIGGWDSFRRTREKTILREVAEQLYRLDRPRKERPVSTDGLTLELPSLFHLADASSLAGQRRFLAATRVRLIMLAVGAGAGSVGLISPWPDVLPFILAAAAFAAALCADLFIMQNLPDRLWFQGRAAAETAKSLAWRYAVGGEPFALPSGDAADPDRELVKRLNDILQDLGDLELSPTDGEGGHVITQTMRDLRVGTLEARKQAYETQRIDDQRSWYAVRAGWNGLRARRWTTAIVSVEALGTMFAVLNLAHEFRDLAWLLGVCGASGAAAAAWSQTRRHREMATSYSVAANELASIRELIPWQETEQSWAAFVGDAERAISREHSLWRVSRGVR